MAILDCGGGPNHKVDLALALGQLAGVHHINELHLEAGHKLGGSFLREGLVDELLVYLAPKLLGPGAGLAHIGPFSTLEQGLSWQFVEACTIGTDLRIRARRHLA